MSAAPTSNACMEKEIRVVQPRCEWLIKAESSSESANIGALHEIRYLEGHRFGWDGRAENYKEKAAYKRGLKELFLLLRCRRITSAAAYPAASESREQLLQAWVPES